MQINSELIPIAERVLSFLKIVLDIVRIKHILVSGLDMKYLIQIR
jgi:hypothetical protein